MKSSLIIAAAVLAVSFSAQAQVEIREPWVRATVAHQKATGAFMHITAERPMRLIGAHSSVAGVVEIHEMALEGDIAKMRPIPALDLPAGEAVELKPGGYHIMLLELKEQVRDGDSVPITLVVEGEDGMRESVELNAPVRPLHQHGGHAR